MSLNILVIISGPPGSGKTTLGQKLATDFKLPFIYKDGIKELLFDTLGWSDREWSRKLGAATNELLYYFVEVELKAGRSLIVESNFHPEFATPSFLKFQAKYPYHPLQIQCVTKGEVLLERYQKRWKSGERHPGHVENDQFDYLKPSLLKGRYEVLEIGGELIEIDTTDFAKIDYTQLYSAIKNSLG